MSAVMRCLCANISVIIIKNCCLIANDFNMMRNGGIAELIRNQQHDSKDASTRIAMHGTRELQEILPSIVLERHQVSLVIY